MKRIPLAVAVSMLVSGAAAAQTVARQHDAVEIASHHRALIKRYARQHHVNRIWLDRPLPAGSVAPKHVAFDPLPTVVIAQNPRLEGYGYFLAETGTYIVDPGSRRVITSID
ncbi:DUF1236 domain-containing protein [Methylobacterium sp. ID0610]|uniref:DUF1236 domain-containing protein n=1 Tax=Methylobacterium carpenticola TaxID=3344827 RepID=UPI00369C7508